MKNRNHPGRVILLGIALALIIALAITAYMKSQSKSYPLPDVLQKTVGTVSMSSFTNGISDGEGYRSLWIRTFTDTTEADYTALMEHYRSASTGTGENNSLLFDWGWLSVTSDSDSITVNAYLK